MNLCKQLEDTPTRFWGQPRLGLRYYSPAPFAGRIFFSNPSAIFIQTSASLTRPFNFASEIKFRLTSILCENSEII